MADNKKSFIAYCDWQTQLDLLSDDEAGKLFRHLLAYVNDENPEFTNDERILKMAFEPMRKQLLRDLESYETVKKKRAEAGRMGGLKSGESRSKPSKPEANEANASIAKQNEANEAVNDNGNVNVNDNVILLEKETKGENEFSSLSQNLENKNQDEFQVKTETEIISKKVAPKKVFKTPTVEEVQEYCNERGNWISAESFVSFYQSKGWMIGNNKMKDWKASVRTWEQKNKSNGNSNSNSYNANNRFSNNNSNTYGGAKVSGKVSASSILARKAREQFARNGNSGDTTIEVEVVRR